MNDPINWQTIEAGIYDWLVPAVVQRVIFANQSYPQPTYPYCSVLITGSAKEGGRDERRTVLDLTRARHVRVTPTAANLALYTVEVNDEPASYVSDASATAAEICTGLAAALLALDPDSEAFTVTNNGSSIDLEVVGDAFLYLGVTANLAWANLDIGNEVELLTTGPRLLTMSFTFHVDEAAVRAGGPNANAMLLAEKARSSLGLRSVLDNLSAAGLVVVAELGINDVSREIQGVWVNRAALDVRFRTQSNLSDYVGYIEKVQLVSEQLGVDEILDAGA